MKNVRIIPRLDIKGPNLVKGIHLEGLRVLGSPEEFAQFYYEEGADELMYMDVVASLYERNSLKEIITRTAKQTFIPLSVGGGIRTLDDINDVLRAGADKVSMNTAAIHDPEFIRAASRKFGSSTIVIAIEAIKEANGSYLAYTDNGREHTGIDAFEWACRAEELGAGEIVATSVDREGTGEGFDVEFVRRVSESVSIPVIAHGGAGSVDDVQRVVAEGKADAVALASILHYDYISRRNEVFTSEGEGNTEFLKRGLRAAHIAPADLNAVRCHLLEQGTRCRPVEPSANTFEAS